MNTLRKTVLLTLATFALPPGTTSAVAADPVNYNRDIKPILANNCYTCHGPDENKREAKLRLDTEAGARAALRKNRHAVVPGKSAESELFKRITATDPDDVMPPSESGKTLSANQIDLIRRWIDQGAKFDRHWAFIQPAHPAVPNVNHRDWPINAIDYFTLARLKNNSLSPSEPADGRTLIRRLFFDLTGLPPTAQQVRDFQADPSRYEQWVDRLLAAPQFGERLAMYWLDLVRFADTNGIHGDNHRDVAAFRDYVINAFNSNKPFDQFTIEQLAGDLFSKPTTEQLVASGYNRLLLTTREGGAQPKEYLAKYMADRVRNTAAVWLGATMGCAECHNHKFDPYTMKDFYSLGAFFAGLKETAVGAQEPGLTLPSKPQAAQLKQLNAQLAAQQKTLNTQTPQLDTAQTQWEASLESRKHAWTVLIPTKATSKGGSALKTLYDGSILAVGTNPSNDTYTLTFKTDLKAVTALRLEVLPDETLPADGPGRAGNGNFVLNAFELSANGQPVPWSGATASHSQNGYTVKGAIDKKPKTGWAIHPAIGKASHAVFETKTNLGDGKEITLTVVMRQNHDGAHTIGRFRLSATTMQRPVKTNDVPANIADLIAIAPAKRSDEQKKTLAAHYRTFAPELVEVRKMVASITRQRDELNAKIPTMLIAQVVEPRVVRVLPRGNWLDETGPVVQPSVPEFLGKINAADRRGTRMDLAQWLVGPENPILARLTVNRLWKLAFGRGLVKTIDDFGSQGAMPTHPALLDWLAVEFVDSGWDVKHVLKLIVMSSTYRQSSYADDAMRERDPANDLLARQGRFRLDAEMVRDNALSISGLLSLKMGGRSVKPYQPAGYWGHLNFPKRTYQPDTGENQYRRGLYTYWCRTFLHPAMLAFDAPSREECTVERPRSNTPLQALVLLNDPTYVEAARVLAEKIIRQGGTSPEHRLTFAYQQTLNRDPLPREAVLLTNLYKKHLGEYNPQINLAKQVQNVGQVSSLSVTKPDELAAWTSVARVLLNLHETITRY